MINSLKNKSNSYASGFLRQIARILPILCVISMFSGCGDFFSEKGTEIESKNILREISKIDYSSDTAIQVPEIYKFPPQIIEGKIGDVKDAKLFYFTQFHSPNDLSKLINEQFIKKFFDAKGKAAPVRDYNVSVNSGANQLIVRCPSVADAQEVLTFLEQVDVPPIQVKIDCIISEVYADHTMDWETTVDIQDLLGTDLNLSGKNVDGSILPAFPGAALRDVARSTFGLKAGFVHGSPGSQVNALIDLLVSRGYLKILMNPTLEVVNGKTASIKTEEKVPMDQISNVHPVTGIISLTTRYEEVIDSLEITPTVYGDGYIGIKTKAIIGSKSTPEGVKQVPIVTKREINIEENRIRTGQSLVIGGITKTEKRSVVRGVPFLKDIPIIGVLFSSKDFEERGKEVLFIITPTISTGGTPNEKMIDKLRVKHEMLKPENNLLNTISDPLGHNIYTDLVEKEAIKAETGRIRVGIERDNALRKAELLQKKLDILTGGTRDATLAESIARELVQQEEVEGTKSTHETTIDEWMKKRAAKRGASTPK